MNGSETKAFVTKKETDNGTICLLNDGCDYEALLALYRSGCVKATPLSGGTPERQTMLLEHEGRKFVLKRDWRNYKHLDTRLKYMLYGPPFEPVMRKVAKAINSGYDRIPRIYLIEQAVRNNPEKGGFLVEAWILLEYLEGCPLVKHPEKEKFYPQIPYLLRELHKHKLVQTDPNNGNFLVAGDKLKAIDLHFFSTPFHFTWPCDVQKVKLLYNLDVPLDTTFEKVYSNAMMQKRVFLKNFHRAYKRVLG